MRWRPRLLCGAILLLAAPATASAQARSCNQELPADFVQIVNARGENVVYFRDPIRLVCGGGLTLSGDSAIYNRSSLAMELIGSVVYRDSTNQLTADWANYISSVEQVLARGDVVLTDLQDGSTVTGRELQYLRQTRTRPLSQVVMRGDRPRAVLRETPAEPLGPAPAVPPPATDTAGPVEITADRLEFLGDSLFLAQGDVDIVRGATTGASDSARYDRAAERLTLLGNAHVRDDRYRLEGQRIDAFVRGETLREVLAEDRTALISEDLTVRSQRLRIGFVDGALERLEAWNPPPAPGDTTSLRERAVALAEDFRLRADSIDAVADSGTLREVRAVGRAYGERRLDSLAVRVPATVARDWIQGDTIIGYFATVSAPADGPPTPPALTSDGAVEPEPADSTELVLERVVVVGPGGTALSLYRMEPESEGGQGAINFMKASRIILFMTEGEVARVEAEGPIEGIYLDPVTSRVAPPPQAPPEGNGDRESGR